MEERFQNDLRSISELGDAVGRNGRDRVRHEVCLRYTRVRSFYDDNRDGFLFFFRMSSHAWRRCMIFRKLCIVVAQGVVTKIERHPSR
jgi:hypothetical protein